MWKKQAAFCIVQNRTFAVIVLAIYNRSTKEECQMKKKKYYVTYTPDESRIALYALNNLRNKLLREGRDSGCVDELFLKMIKAPVRKR